MADVPDRTLRRWLGELVHEGVIERSGSRKGTRYRWKPSAKGEEQPPTVAADADAGGCVIHAMSVHDFTACRSSISGYAGQGFHAMSVQGFMACRSSS